MPNINAITGIPFGYIAASALDSEVVDELLYGRGAVDCRTRPPWTRRMSARARRPPSAGSTMVHRTGSASAQGEPAS